MSIVIMIMAFCSEMYWSLKELQMEFLIYILVIPTLVLAIVVGFVVWAKVFSAQSLKSKKIRWGLSITAIAMLFAIVSVSTITIIITPGYYEINDRQRLILNTKSFNAATDDEIIEVASLAYHRDNLNPEDREKYLPKIKEFYIKDKMRTPRVSQSIAESHYDAIEQ